MKTTIKVIFSILFFTSFSSCGDSASKELVKQLKSSYDKEGQTVELIGYPALGKLTFVKQGKMELELGNAWGQSEGSLATIELSFGKEANQGFLPEEYKFEDLEIYDKDGKKLDPQSKIKIKGKVTYTKKDWKEEIDKEIEKNKLGSKMVEEQQKKRKEKAKQAAEEREKETGDPNDYSFIIEVESIESVE